MTTHEALLWRILGHLTAAVELVLEKLIALHSPRVTLGFGVGLVTLKPRINPMEITITNEQQVEVTLHPVTQGGQPAPVDGVPTWEVVSGNSTVIPAADGMSAILRSGDDPGDTQFLVKADADIGEGNVEISGIISLHVAGAAASNLGLVAGEPTLKT